MEGISNKEEVDKWLYEHANIQGHACKGINGMILGEGCRLGNSSQPKTFRNYMTRNLRKAVVFLVLHQEYCHHLFLQ